MSDLPYSDPSNPALPSPLFSDVTAVRADHMRANNAAIFADLTALNNRNPELVALTGGSFKTAALANANTYNGRSLFTCTAGVSDTPSAAAWRIIGYWNPTDSSGRFVAMADASLETWEINYAGGVWGTWTKFTDSYNNRFANAFVGGYNTTATSGGTLTLDVSSAQNQFFTGTLAHTVVLPVANTLTQGRTFSITNNSTKTITVKSSGGNLVAVVSPAMTRQFVCILTSGTDAASWFASFSIAISEILTSQVDGLAISNAADVDHDVTIGPGKIVDTTFTTVLQLTSNMTKRLDASWAAGNGNGGLFSGSIAATTWYYIVLIKNDITGAVDWGFDTSAAAANKPAGWTAYAILNAVVTSSSSKILPFYNDGNKMTLKTPTAYHANDPGTNAVLVTVTCPPSHEAMVTFSMQNDSAATISAGLLTSPNAADIAPTHTTIYSLVTSSASRGASADYVKRTDSSSRLRYRLQGSTPHIDVYIFSLGWIFNR